MDRVKLRALAEKATPGPWKGDRIDGTVKYNIISGDYPGTYKVVCHGDNGNACDGGYGFTNAEDENYALAANPTAVLALLDALEAADVKNTLLSACLHKAEDERDRLREDAERYRFLREDRDLDETSLWIARGDGTLVSRWTGESVDAMIDAARKPA